MYRPARRSHHVLAALPWISWRKWAIRQPIPLLIHKTYTLSAYFRDR
jgi:hypothetical protein